MWKLLMFTMAALAIAGSSLVYAQQRDGDRAGGARFEQHHHKLSFEDRAAFVDARLAALKAGLELTPDQAKKMADVRTGFARHGSIARPAQGGP
jgi:hypothetical protein